MTTPLFTTKLHIPQPRPNLIPRRRLTKRLDEALRLGHRLLLACAPAWFGKTTLLSEWIHGSGRHQLTKVREADLRFTRVETIINPDVCNCGGILELLEIATMAEPYHVTVAPHNYNSTTAGLAATLHAAARMPNFLITEYFVNFQSQGAEIARQPFQVENGYIALPTAPGLGIDLDETALTRHPLQALPARRLRQPHEE